MTIQVTPYGFRQYHESDWRARIRWYWKFNPRVVLAFEYYS